MSDPNTAGKIGKLFEGMPEVTVRAEAGWSGFSQSNIAADAKAGGGLWGQSPRHVILHLRPVLSP